MAFDPRTFLATTVLSDGNVVSYRSLSRELKVHNNAAKRMLYDFHKVQNSKKPRSVYATYFLDGIPLVQQGSGANMHTHDDDDLHMQSSPYMSSSMPQEMNTEKNLPARRIILAREEDLEAVKETYERIHSIHIYSLSPGAVQDIQVLSDCNRAVSTKFISEDPLVAGKGYGVIQNSNVRRRIGKRQIMPVPIASTVKASSKATGTNIEAEVSTQDPKRTDRPSSSSQPAASTSRPSSKSSEKKQVSKPSSLKREASDIFKSFSKPKAKLSREESSSSIVESSTSTKKGPDTNSNPPDVPMENASDEENDKDFMEITTSKSAKAKSRSERQEELRQMMDDEEEDMETGAYEISEASQESKPLGNPGSQKMASPEPPLTVTGGRRRGRRKIMKKKTIKDEEGYLVTKEEPAWESFSEDEIPPHEDKRPASSASTSTAKGSKSGGKPGQGNIMSFFGKK